MRNGDAAESGLELSGSHLTPVGVDDPSTLGASPSATVDSWLYELNLKWTFEPGGWIAGAFGQAFVEDDVSAFDRDILWFIIEVVKPITDDVYVAARYSEIGTYDDDEGYHFSGEIVEDAAEDLGFDVRRLQRASIGIGWRPVQRVLVKVEAGHDWYGLIDASPFETENGQRWFAGFEVDVTF